MTLVEEEKKEIQYVCTDDGTADELKVNQKEMMNTMKNFGSMLENFKASQDRMFKMIVKVENKVDTMNEEMHRELAKGHKKFVEFEKFMGKKNTSNGYIKRDIKNLQKDVKEKASKEDLEIESKTTEEKLNLIVKYSKDAVDVQKEFQKNVITMLWKVLTAVFIVFGSIVTILGLFLQY